MDLFYEISNLALESIAPGIRRFVFTLEQMMGAYFEIDPGVVVGEHCHPNEQLGILIRGTIRWRVRDQEIVTHAPALYRIPSEEPHGAEILGEEPAVLLDVYHPIREEFLKAGPVQYIKGSPRA